MVLSVCLLCDILKPTRQKKKICFIQNAFEHLRNALSSWQLKLETVLDALPSREELLILWHTLYVYVRQHPGKLADEFCPLSFTTQIWLVSGNVYIRNNGKNGWIQCNVGNQSLEFI